MQVALNLRVSKYKTEYKTSKNKIGFKSNSSRLLTLINSIKSIGEGAIYDHVPILPLQFTWSFDAKAKFTKNRTEVSWVLPFWAVTENFFSLLNYVTLMRACAVEWPMLWLITMNSLHNEGIYEWVNQAPIFVWYQLLPTTYGLQQFAKLEQ